MSSLGIKQTFSPYRTIYSLIAHFSTLSYTLGVSLYASLNSFAVLLYFPVVFHIIPIIEYRKILLDNQHVCPLANKLLYKLCI